MPVPVLEIMILLKWLAPGLIDWVALLAVPFNITVLEPAVNVPEFEKTVPVPERVIVAEPALKLPETIVSAVEETLAERIVGPVKLNEEVLTWAPLTEILPEEFTTKLIGFVQDEYAPMIIAPVSEVLPICRLA